MVVPDVTIQDQVVERLRDVFPKISIVDRRAKPSHGYRAVHVIVEVDGKTVEIQVRSALQHLWAELSEKLSDVIDPKIKYGGGREKIQELLLGFSNTVTKHEFVEVKAAKLSTILTDENIKRQLQGLDEKLRKSMGEAKEQMEQLIQLVNGLIIVLERERRKTK